MEQNYLPRAAKFLAAQRKRKRWQKVVGCLGAAVVFCTVYALILPAITMTRPLVCGLEEHQHDESCYAVVEPAAEASPLADRTAVASAPEIRQICSMESVYAGLAEEEHAPFVLHTHDASCYRDGVLICTFPEVAPHVHDESCYVRERILICGQEEEMEILDDLVPAGHVHTEDCYADVLVCGQEEVPASEGHHHDESCYTLETVQGDLICTNTEEGHQHDESCYAWEEVPVLTCGQEESEPVPGHTHTQDCYQRQLVCGVEEEEGPEGGEETAPGHVHTEDCYTYGEYVPGCGDQRIAHEHTAACYDENGSLICGRLVTREHVHTAECFQEILPPEPDPEPEPEPEKVLICGKTEHTHEESCYGPEEIENPEETGEEQDGQWDAVFWSGVVSEASGTVLDAWTDGSWMDTAAMAPEDLARLREAGEADLTRALQSAAVQVGARAYDSALHGPMDPNGEFSIHLAWSLDSASFSSMTWSYAFPWQINVENVEKRVLNDAGGQPALTYSVWNNVLSVTYYAPAAGVSTGFDLRASWAEELGTDTEIQWSRSESTYVVFAEPELTVEKTMGEEGLRVAEDGSVWADYTVTVTNSGMVAAGDITLTDVLEAERFAFAQGGCENGADYIVTAGGRDSYENFADYDGGSTVTFPAFGLEPGESRVFQYKAVMSAENREAVDAAVKASADPAQAAETVRNTATAVCPAPGGDLEFTSSAKATYGGPESKHVENFTYNYQSESGAFDVAFTVNGDAQLPLGMTAEKLEQTAGEGLQLTVEALDETAGEYQAFAQHVEEDENLLDLQVLKLGLNYNGVKLDLADCDVEATVTPSEALRNYQPPHTVNYNLTEEEKEAAAAAEPLGDEGFGIEVKAFALSEQTDTAAPEFVEAGSLYMDMGDDPEVEETAAAFEPISFAVQNGTMAVQADYDDYPTYNVAFYGKVKLLDVKAYDTEGKLPGKDVTVIDTRNLANSNYLPTNGLGNSGSHIAYLELDAANPREKGTKGYLKTVDTPTPLFRNKTLKFNPNKELNLGMFMILEQFAQTDTATPDTSGETNYTIESFVIIPAGTDEAACTEILLNGRLPSAIRLVDTEVKVQEDTSGNSYLLPGGATLKLICKPTQSKDYIAPTVFYDYDITDGYIYKDKTLTSEKLSVAEQDSLPAAWNSTVYAYVLEQGINLPGNYAGSGSKLAFGNGNGQVPTNLGAITGSDGYFINQANGTNFRKCSFGIAALNMSGNQLQYSNGVIAPKLFNESDTVTGKTVYRNDYQLVFDRDGDTYTMTAVRNAVTGDNVVSGLDQLENTGGAWPTSNPPFTMYSNQFWPMDDAPSFGTEGHDFKFGDTGKASQRQVFGNNPAGNNFKDAPGSDDGKDHNSYFGMQFRVEFTIPEDYIGPLEYCFFGDDDLWLYLDGKLICDIGGVHQAAGEYVDLRKHLPVDGATTVGTHTLDLFYTERGASGSTCWMQFTLPGLRSVPVDITPGDGSGNLRIVKKTEGAIDKDEKFKFDVTLSANGTYDCTYYDKNGFEIVNSSNPAQITISNTVLNKTVASFELKADESVLISKLPIGTTYTISEVNNGSGHTYEAKVESSIDGASAVEQPIDQSEKKYTNTIGSNGTHIVTYTNTFYYALPETGGPGAAGTVWYTMAALPTIAAAGLLYKRSRKKGGTQF